MSVVPMDARDGDDDTHRVRFDDPDTPLSTLVAEAVEEATGLDAASGDLDLYGAVDLDAVDALHRHSRRTGGDWTLAFEVGSYEVVVDGGGEIRVR